jgi:PhnB protein
MRGVGVRIVLAIYDEDSMIDISGASQPQPTRIAAQLSVRRGRAAVEFYKRAFGAVEDYRVGGTDEHEAVVAQLSVAGACFWVADESPAHANFSPESLGGGTARMLLVVEDPPTVCARAIAAGAREVRPVATEHNWLLGRVEDPFGHHWEIGKPLVAWPPGGGAPSAPGR